MTEAWGRRGAHYAESAPHRSGPSLAKLVALARPQAHDSCLDLGTGAGHTAAALAERAAHVVGLDLSAEMLRAARALYGARPNLEFVQAPAHATGLPSGSFDLITARHTLHHHPDPAATLSEAARLLKPGGRLVIVDETTPDARVDGWFGALERLRDPSHVRAYRMDEWRALVAGAGLSWIVGDSDTAYTLEVGAWLERTNPAPATREAVYTLLSRADAHAREVFGIVYEGAQAVRLTMPMALILATKP